MIGTFLTTFAWLELIYLSIKASHPEQLTLQEAYTLSTRVMFAFLLLNAGAYLR